MNHKERGMNKKVKINFFIPRILPNSRRGMSGVIAAVIMIALVMAAVIIVWGVVIPLVREQLTETESCFGIFGKVTINNMYTCHNSSSNNFQFSINIGDIDVDKVVVSVSSEGSTNSYTLTNTDQPGIGLTLYPSGGEIKLPGKNAGSTYIASGFTDEPDLIQIAPVIKGKQCEASDSLSDIDDCSSLV